MTDLELTSQKWLSIFLDFIKELRINSKEVPAIDQRGAPLNLWGSQKIALEQVCSGMEEGIRNFMILKSRQLGISTVFLAVDIFWMAMYPGTIGALVTDTEGNRAVFRETIEKYIASFPRKYLGKGFSISRANKDFILFSNGSRLDLIVAGTKNKKTYGEGRGYALVHATEVANYGSEEGLASFKEALAEANPNRLFIWESTAKGPNHYQDMWEEFGRDSFTKRRIFCGWWSKDLNEIKKIDARYQLYGATEPDSEERELIDAVKFEYNFEVTQEKLAWYRWRSADQAGSKADLDQNQPWTAGQAFVISGQSFFQVRALQKDLERCKTTTYRGYRYWTGTDFWQTKIEEIVEQERIEEVELRVWEEPIEGATYVIGCDPAFGRNEWKDRHAISVFRCFADRLVQVAEYADHNVETRQAAWVLAHLAGTYRNSYINIELTGGPGRAVLTELEYLRDSTKLDPDFDKKAIDTPNINDFLQNARWYSYKRADSYIASRMKCWEMTGRTKPEIMNQIRDNYMTGLVIVHSAHLIKEMLDVVQDGFEIAAPGRKKDDRVISMALANRIWIDEVRLGMIARGETLEKIMEHGYEEVDKTSQFMDNMVNTFFMTAEERLNEPTAEERYMQDRGFI